MSDKKRVRKFLVEFVSNGYVIETYREGSYGDTLESKIVRSNHSEVLSDFIAAVTGNQQIEAEAKKQKEERLLPTCKGCKQAIIFLKTPAGKWLPCEPDPFDWDEAEEGEMVVHEDGTVHRVIEGQVAPHPGNYYLVHWAGCFFSAAFRKED